MTHWTTDYPVSHLRAAFVCTVLAVAGCATLAPESETLTRSVEPGPGTVIYVIRRSWHTDIGFDVADLAAPLSGVHSALPTAHYLLFGFGDRHYLINKDRSVGGLLGALWPGPGVILVTGLTGTPGRAFGEQQVRRITLSTSQAHRLQEFVWNSLRRSAGAVQVLAPGPYDDSTYYAATLRYSGFHTCNTWTADALKAAGLPVSSFGVEFSGQVWHQVGRIERQDTVTSGAH